MNFSRTFPVTAWLWRRLTSRPARLIYLGVLVIVIVPGIALRVEAALFQRRVLKVMSALSSLRIGVTQRAEVLSRMAQFEVREDHRNKSGCEADDCLFIEVSSPKLSDWALRKAGWSGHYKLYTVLSWWRFRMRGLEAYVDLDSDKVSDLGYRFVLSTPDPYDEIVINARSMSSAGRFTGIIDAIADESPDYGVSHHWRRPALNTNVYFTRSTTPELLSHAFRLRLECLWSVRGCLTANQLLPEAEYDRIGIERAASDRLIGPNQCPDWILPGRARDAESILLVEVKNSGPAFIANDDGSHFRRANFRLLRVLKGDPGVSVDKIVVGSEIWRGERAHNSAFDLLKPGQRLLVFLRGDRDRDGYASCEEFAATDSAVQTIETSLATGERQP